MAEPSGVLIIEASELPEDLQERLSLESGESLRLLETAPRTLLLQRIGPRTAFPCDSAPQLRAEVDTLPLSEVLGAVHASGKSGFLYFSYRDHEKSVYLHRGEVVFASSDQRVDRLGECLLRAGVITLEQLREAERCFSPPERFGKVLVERGFLTPRELWNGVKYQVEEIVRSLFSYPAGTVYFWEGEFQPDNVVRLSLETRRLVAEGIQRREELRKFLAVLQDPRVRLAVVTGFEGQLAGNERALVDAIGPERAFPEVCDSLDFDAESAARSIQLLRLVGAVKLMRSEGEPGYVDASDLQSPDEASLRERAKALAELVDGLSEPIRALEGGESLRERLERVLDDATGRFPALLTGISLSSEGHLDPEPLIERARKLPGDREDQLASALNELVVYVEFELKNHPDIHDADTILRGLEEVRGRALGR